MWTPRSVPGLTLLPGDANFSLRCLLVSAREEEMCYILPSQRILKDIATCNKTNSHLGGVTRVWAFVGDFKAGHGLMARPANTADIYLIFNWK